jgi:glycosyltransferase involved in cell wall biosynthesis
VECGTSSATGGAGWWVELAAPLRILYISNGYPPHRWAGTEAQTAAIARECQARGVAVRVLCGGEWQEGGSHYNGHTDSIDQGVRVRRLHFNWTKAADPFRCLYDNPVAGRLADDLFDEFRPDVVHVTSCETLSASVLEIAKRRQIPSVLSLMDFWFLCPRMTLLRSDGENCDGVTAGAECITCLARHSPVYQWPRRLLSERQVETLLAAMGKHCIIARQRGLRGMIGDVDRRKSFLRAALSWPNVRITASLHARQVHLANGVNEEIVVRPYGHDLSRLVSLSEQRRPGRLRFGYIGQILRPKGVHILLAAVRSFARTAGNRIGTVIYGDLKKSPEYERELMALAEGVPEVQFRGTYRHEDSARVYGSFDVLVVPSLWCDFPLVIHEAFATRTPVIASDLGGMAEAVTHNKNGLLFEKGNVEDLERQLARLVEEPRLLDTLRGGIEPVKTIEQVGDELLQCYGALA